MSPDTSLPEVEARAKKIYDRIARTYYTVKHPTSYAFDESIQAYLTENKSLGRPYGVHLDIGCGRTQLSRIIPLGTAVLLDLSRLMLLQSLKDDNNDRVVGSALHLPIASSSVTVVYAFLGDAFAYVEFFEEVHRVLERNGVLLEILPSRIWAETLRTELRILPNETYFLEDGIRLFAPSITYDRTSLEKVLSEAGFRSIEWEHIFLPPKYAGPISDHISIPAEVLNVDPHKLPLLVAVRARK